MSAASPTGTSGVELVSRIFELINSHDVATLKEQVWTHEMVQRFPDRTCHGPQELAEYFETLFAAVPDLRMEILSLAQQATTCSCNGGSPAPTTAR